MHGVDGSDVVPGNLQPLLHGGAHVFDDDVGGLHQAHERRVAFGRLQIQPDRALVAMQVLKVEAVPHAGGVLTGGRRLDADDVRAPVGEVPHAGRPGAREREIQDANA